MKRRFTLALTTSIATIGCIAFTNASNSSQSDVVAGQCFYRDDAAQTDFPVISQMAPPTFVDGDYNIKFSGYPASTFATSTLNPAGSQTELATGASGFRSTDYYWLWGNRCAFLQSQSGIATPDDPHNANLGCEGNRKQTSIGNDNPYAPQNDSTFPRPIFSTYQRANVCTMMQLRRLLNGVPSDPARVAAVGAKFGLNIYDMAVKGGATVDRSLGQPIKYNGAWAYDTNHDLKNYLVDVCILAPARMSKTNTGVVLDWEVADNRDPGMALEFFQKLAEIAHGAGKKLIVMTNDLGNTVGTVAGVPYARNGISQANVHQLLAIVDGFAPVVFSGASLGSAGGVPASPRSKDFASDWCTQRKILAPTAAERAKIWLNVSLFDLRPSANPKADSDCASLPAEFNEAYWLHQEVVNHGYAGVMLWRNGVAQGGACDAAWSPDPAKYPSAADFTKNQMVNQQIACLTMGQCRGTFRSN